MLQTVWSKFNPKVVYGTVTVIVRCAFETLPTEGVLGSVYNQLRSRRCNFAQRMHSGSCGLLMQLQALSLLDIWLGGKKEVRPPESHWSDNSFLPSLESFLVGRKRCRIAQ